MFIKFNFPVALNVMFSNGLMANVENSLVRTFTLFPKRYFYSTIWVFGSGKYVYSLNVHQVQFSSGIKRNVQQWLNGKCRKLSCKNFHTFSETLLLLHDMGIRFWEIRL